MDPADFLSVAALFSRFPAGSGTPYGSGSLVLRPAAVFQGKGSDYGRLVHYLQQSENPGLQKVCEKLKKLRTLRNRADYEMDETIDANQSELAYQWAGEAVRILAGS